MIETRTCDRFHDIPIKGADFIIIADCDTTMSYIDVPITEAFDTFLEEYTDDNGNISVDITEDMLIDYITKDLLEQGYKDFHIYKRLQIPTLPNKTTSKKKHSTKLSVLKQRIEFWVLQKLGKDPYEYD